MFIAVEEIFERAVTDLSDEPGSCAGASGRPGARWDSGISPQIRQKYTLASQQGDHRIRIKDGLHRKNRLFPDFLHRKGALRPLSRNLRRAPSRFIGVGQRRFPEIFNVWDFPVSRSGVQYGRVRTRIASLEKEMTGALLQGFM